MPVIEPTDLQPDAMVAACTDNQYVEEELFVEMVTDRLDFASSEVQARRRRAFRTEFNRALLFSTQTVVNRAAMLNTAQLFELYAPGAPTAADFASLMDERAIVPYLFRESSLDVGLQQQVGFGVLRDSEVALNNLMQLLSAPACCVRLARAEADNDRETAIMAGGMSRKVVGTLSAAESRKIVVADLIPDDEVAKTALYALMDEVAAFMFAARNAEKPATRHDLYARFISGSGDTAVERGVFAPAASPKVAFALKAYIDLAYTTNLSDALDRYYLAAPGLPGRSVLNDAFMRNSHHAETFEKLASETVLERLAASTFDLPHYADLELSDVRAIRHSASWAAFNVSVKAYLERPFDAGRLGTLAEAHRYMLEGLTKHVRERRNDLRVRRVEAVTGVMIEVAGRGILLASCDAAIWHALLHSVFSTVRKVVKGYAVRVVFAFIDPITRRLDTNLTTSVEVARSKAEIAVEQVRELLRGLSEGSSVRMAELDADVAEAGKH